MGRPRGPSAQTAARRREILRAARDSFVEHGVQGASLRDVAARAGMTHAGLLHHYKRKNELVVALRQQRDAEEAGRSVDDDPAGAAALPPLLRQLLEEHQTAPELLRLWLEMTAAAAGEAHPAHDYFADRYTAVRTTMTEDARRRIAAGTLREDVDPEHFGALMAAVLDGLQLQWLHDRDLPVVDTVEHFLELLRPSQPAGDGAHVAGRGKHSQRAAAGSPAVSDRP